MAAGYDDSATRFLVRNSWGAGWGDARLLLHALRLPARRQPFRRPLDDPLGPVTSSGDTISNYSELDMVSPELTRLVRCNAGGRGQDTTQCSFRITRRDLHPELIQISVPQKGLEIIHQQRSGLRFPQCFSLPFLVAASRPGPLRQLGFQGVTVRPASHRSRTPATTGEDGGRLSKPRQPRSRGSRHRSISPRRCLGITSGPRWLKPPALRPGEWSSEWNRDGESN